MAALRLASRVPLTNQLFGFLAGLAGSASGRSVRPIRVVAVEALEADCPDAEQSPSAMSPLKEGIKGVHVRESDGHRLALGHSEPLLGVTVAVYKDELTSLGLD